MSGTPKKTIATLDVELTSRLQTEHQREGHKRRSLWHEMMKRREIKELHHEIREGHLMLLEKVITKHENAVNEAALVDMRAECNKLGCQLDAATTQDEFLSGLHTIKALRERLDREIICKQENQAKAIADVRERLVIRLQSIETVLATEDETDRQQYDPAGIELTATAISTAREAISTGDVAQGEEQVARAHTAVEQHLARTRDERQRRQEARKIAITFQALTVALQSNPVVQRWCPTEAAMLNAEISTVEKVATEGDMPTLTRLVYEARVQANAIQELAESRQQQALEKTYIADKLRQTLISMGFTVGEPSYENTSDPLSTVCLPAYQANGRQMKVQIDSAGNIEFAVDKHNTRIEQQNGIRVTTCDALEKTLVEMQQRLERDGIQTSTLEWDGKPQAQAKTRAAELPMIEQPHLRTKQRETRL